MRLTHIPENKKALMDKQPTYTYNPLFGSMLVGCMAPPEFPGMLLDGEE